MKGRLAFTLIELLFVVVVIAVLAAISVPNFLEAQVRSKVSRVRGDMAALSMALRSYYADHGRYPANSPEVRRQLEAPPEQWPSSPGSKGNPFLLQAGYDLSVLTTPVPYQGTSLPIDPFHNVRHAPYVYVNLADLDTTSSPSASAGRLPRYLLLSYGPDTDSARPSFANPALSRYIPYDPTNGTISRGDIVDYGDWSGRALPEDLLSGSGSDNATRNDPDFI